MQLTESTKIGHVLINQHFQEDISRILRQDILDIGYPESAIDEKNVIYQYCVLHKRLIKKKPRNILYADSFVRPVDSNLAAGLAQLERKILIGESINPHLSTRMDEICYKDGMLFDWNIYHFHMGIVEDSNKYAGRTRDVLYAVVTEDNIYFLMVADHGHWTDKDLLEIIARNWKFLLDNYVIDGDIEKVFDDKDISDMRKGNINVLQRLSNGKSYVPMGGGLATNGTSIDAQRGRAEIVRYIRGMVIDVKRMAIRDILNRVSVADFVDRHPIGMPYVYQFVLTRTNDDTISILQLLDGGHRSNIIAEYEFISLNKMING